MGVLPFRRKKSEVQSDLTTLLHKAQSGDEKARNELIEQYIPFVLRIASQASHRYIERSKDDEFSVALLAMNEAIDRFDVSRNVGFLGFAETIIRRRLIDYFRTQKSVQKQMLWSEFDVVDDEDNITNYLEVKKSVEVHAELEEQASRTYEIEEYSLALRYFDLTFEDLVTLSPKHEDARENALSVAKLIVSDVELYQYVMQKKSLPLKLLEEKVALSRKTLERQRKYILALIVLLTGDFPLLQSFIS